MTRRGGGFRLNKYLSNLIILCIIAAGVVSQFDF
jgi:hypothetical protein